MRPSSHAHRVQLSRPAGDIAAPRVHDEIGGPVGAMYRDLAGRMDAQIVPIMPSAHTDEPAIAALSRIVGYATLLGCYVAIAAWFMA